MVVDGDDAGMAHLAGRLGLALEPHEPLRCEAVGPHDLDGDPSPDAALVGEPDLAHRSPADRATASQPSSTVA